MKHILIVEDDKALAAGIALALQTQNLQIETCASIAQAREILHQKTQHLFIIDINLPDGSGLDLLCHIQKVSTTPVILLTANDMETDIVTGLEMGADDYITKPFSLAVLRARVNTQLRKKTTANTHRFEQGCFHFDFDQMTYLKNNQSVDLSKTEQKLLRLLVENRGHTLQRSLLVDRIWGNGAEYVDENALSVTIKRLRDKLEEQPARPQYIKTIYGMGYTWAVD